MDRIAGDQNELELVVRSKGTLANDDRIPGRSIINAVLLAYKDSKAKD